MNLPAPQRAPTRPDAVIPVLTDLLPESELTDALRAALDARAHEKSVFMNLSVELLDVLRPEMERMVTELVHKSVDQAWRLRSRAGD